MKINGVELEDIDIYELETMEKAERAIDKVLEDIKALDRPNLSGSEAIRIQCHAIMDCFNSIFGEDTDKKLFGDKTNILICVKSFEELMKKFEEKKKEIETYTSKYSPNRAQRRAKK